MSLKGKMKSLQYNIYLARLNKVIENNIKKSLSLLDKKGAKRTLSKQQINDIIDFYYELTGSNISTLWHQYYFSRTGIYSLEYIPENLYITKFIYKLNDFEMRKFYADKNQYELLFPHVNQPKTILKKINGYYYINNELIQEKDVYSLCSNLNNVIIKPSIETSFGDNVRLLSSSMGVVQGTCTRINDYLSKYGNNFIIQDKVKQHNSLELLNSSSINTIRIFSYLRETGDVEILTSNLRIGKNGSLIDNVAAGGVFVGLNSEGLISSNGFDEATCSEFLKSSNGTLLKGHKIHCLPEIHKIVKNMHTLTPYLRLIGWDFSVDIDGKPIFIELNRCPDLCLFQSASGPALGKLHKEIFESIKLKLDTRRFNITK